MQVGWLAARRGAGAIWVPIIAQNSHINNLNMCVRARAYVQLRFRARTKAVNGGAVTATQRVCAAYVQTANEMRRPWQ